MSQTDSENADQGPACTNSTDSRRGFGAKVAAICLGLLAFTAPVCAAVVSFLNPLKLKGQGGRFFFLTTLESLPENGAPRRFPVIDDRVDGWNTFANDTIGAVLLRRTGDAKKQVEAFNVICPHAGCFIGFDAEKNEFLCPCHLAHFDLQGKRTNPDSKSPRDMDTLEVEIRNEREVWVKFQDFKQGTSKKIPMA